MKKCLISLILPLLIISGCQSKTSSSLVNSSKVISSIFSSETSSSTSSSSSSKVMISKEEVIVETLRNNFSALGEYEVNGVKHTLEVVFLEDIYFNKDCYDNYEDILFYRKDEKGIYEVSLDKYNNEVLKLLDASLDSWNEGASNPFKNITKDNLKLLENGDYQIELEGLLTSGCKVITGWGGSYESVKVRVNDNNVSLFLECETKYDGHVSYSLNLTEAYTPTLKCEINENKEVLETAFSKIGNNYTLKTTNKMSGEEDVISYIYRNQDILFNSYEDNNFSNYGFYFEDDRVREFTVVDGKVSNLEDSMDYTLEDFRFDFDFSFDLFKYDKVNDIYVSSGYPLTLISNEFGYDPNTKSEYEYFASQIEIKLDSNLELEYYEVRSEVYGLLMTTKYEFSNLGTTQMPFDTSAFEAKNNEISNQYFATYQGDAMIGSFDNETHLEVTINENGLVINNKHMEVIEFSDFNEIIFSFNDEEYYISNASYEASGTFSKIQISNESGSFYCLLDIVS